MRLAEALTQMSLANSPGAGMTSSPSRGASSDLHWGNLMVHDVGTVVLRSLASSTADGTRTARLISKDCRQLVDSSVHGLKANLTALSSNSAEQLPLHFPRLQRLAFDRVGGGSNASQLLVRLAQQQPQLLARLQELDLSNCHKLEAGALAQLLRCCRGLHSLALPLLSEGVESNRQDFLEAITMHASRLTQLLGAGDYVCPAGIHLLPRLQQLQALDISPGKSCPLLLSPPALQPLAKLIHLQRLRLGSHLARYDTFALAASLPELQSLVFVYADGSAASHADLAPLVASTSLQELQLCSASCGDEVLGVLTRTRVSKLVLQAGRFCGSAKGAGALAQQLTALQLRVNDADMRVFAAVLPSLKALTSLSLSMHRAVESCTELMRAVFGLPQLQSLSLESHYNGIREPEATNLPALVSLQTLSLTNHFTDATLCALLHSTPALRSLRLASCGAVGDAGLSCVSGLCSRLREVHLELMRGVSVVGVEALAGGRCVQHVVVEGCRNVSAQECRQVQQQLAEDNLDLQIVKLR